MKNFCKKTSSILKWIFGSGVALCLFAGGLTFFGYLAALIIGGDTAAEICRVIYKDITPIIIKASTVLILVGLVAMYLNGEVTLVPEKGEKTNKK